VSALFPGPDGARVDTEHVGQDLHAESLSLAEVTDHATEIGGLGNLPGVVTEELDHGRQCPETGGCGSGLPIEDSGLVDPDSQRNLPLEESEVQTALSDMVAD
jgi:hypothetical protein